MFRNLAEGLVDLNTLIPADSGWVLEEATGINDSGWITGSGWINGERHAFLLKPVGITVAPPTISKAFANSTIAFAANTTLTFTLGNPSVAIALTGVGFTDPLPTGIIVSTPNGLTNSCGGTITAVAGSTSVTLSGGTLAGNATCTISVIVKGNSLGSWTNVTGPVSSTESGEWRNSNSQLSRSSNRSRTVSARRQAIIEKLRRSQNGPRRLWDSPACRHYRTASKQIVENKEPVGSNGSQIRSGPQCYGLLIAFDASKAAIPGGGGRPDAEAGAGTSSVRDALRPPVVRMFDELAARMSLGYVSTPDSSYMTNHRIRRVVTISRRRSQALPGRERS